MNEWMCHSYTQPEQQSHSLGFVYLDAAHVALVLIAIYAIHLSVNEL